MPKLLKQGDQEGEGGGIMSMYGNMNSYQKAALGVEEAVHQPYPSNPLPLLFQQIITMAILWHMPAKQLCVRQGS